MPSPFGHALAGVGIALACDQRLLASRRLPGVFVICGLLAAAPDSDLLYPNSHRMMTHSLFAVGLVALCVMTATRYYLGQVSWRLTFACALAYGSHLAVDYFGVDRWMPAGIQLLWPWSPQWFISDWYLFLETDRSAIFSVPSMAASLALIREVLIIGPFILLFWLRRQRLVHGNQTEFGTLRAMSGRATASSQSARSDRPAGQPPT